MELSPNWTFLDSSARRRLQLRQTTGMFESLYVGFTIDCRQVVSEKLPVFENIFWVR
jgi:hypothetical protein